MILLVEILSSARAFFILHPETSINDASLSVFAVLVQGANYLPLNVFCNLWMI